jgi:hypothetical protein
VLRTYFVSQRDGDYGYQQGGAGKEWHKVPPTLGSESGR